MRQHRQECGWFLDCQRSLRLNLQKKQGSVLSPFLFALVADVVTGLSREGALSELLYADE